MDLLALDEAARGANDYWQSRHRDALLKAQEAAYPALRSTYFQLAEHYRAMAHLLERRAPAWR
jgi:hypothetical protein